MKTPQNVFNVPFEEPLMDVLAQKFLAEYKHHPLELTDVLFLTPNRRSALCLKEAFMRANGLKPALLPKILPIDDESWNDFYLFGDLEDDENIKPAMPLFERLFLFAKLIYAKPETYGFKGISYAEALSLAYDLGALLDLSYNENLNFEDLEKIVPSQYATHWQDTLKFLKIITHHFPLILEERGLTDAVCRKNMLFEKLAEIWQKKPPENKIVAVGVNGAYLGVRKLLKAIKNLPSGEIFISGLDRFLTDEQWEFVDETHPQFELKNLLEFLELKREDVPDFCGNSFSDRAELIYQTLKPAKTTFSWQNLKESKLFGQTPKGIYTTSCEDLNQEAQVIALLLRETLETPDKTAALVTTDRNLARRVASYLKKWDIEIDDSAGVPLNLTPIGIYLRQILQVLQNNFLFSDVLALLKSPFVKLGYEPLALRGEIQRLERQKRTSAFGVIQDEGLLYTLKEQMKPLEELFEKEKVSLKEILTAHIKTAETLSLSTENDSIWKGQEGKVCAALLAEINEFADKADEIEPFEYIAVFDVLISKQQVRSVYGTHPRLKILGLIEARFNRYDRVIAGELNEGVWPSIPPADPWLSRAMKKDFKMPLADRNIGMAASDFCGCLAAPEVFLIRANRVDGAPTNKSRFLMRFETVLEALNVEPETLEDTFIKSLAEQLDKPEKEIKILPAAPCPPVEARPRKLSATAVEKLMRNPYEIYARYILKLKKLDDVDKLPGASEYGDLIHQALDDFVSEHGATLPENAQKELEEKIFEKMNALALTPVDEAFWRPKIKNTICWFIAEQQEIIDAGLKNSLTEVNGKIEFEAPAGLFTLEARADRLDFMADKSVNVIDYKTGQIRSKKEIELGYAPQLPIEGLIEANGGFLKNGQPVEKADSLKLSYWRLGEKIVNYDLKDNDLLEKTLERLKKLIACFDLQTTPYLARPNPKHIDQYADFEHLSRFYEWSVGEDDE